MLLQALFLPLTHADAPVIKYNLISGKPDIYITPLSEEIGHTWSGGYVWEKHLIQKFYSLLPTNEHFVAIDLGAQTSCFSLLAKYLPNSTWYALEPIEEAATTLQENLRINDIHNVSVYQVAASDYSGKAILKMPAMNAWGLSTLGSNPMRFTATMEREIECIDLDSFVTAHAIPRVHFMKLDTEGSELYILRGAKNMIMRDHPIMLIEYNETNMKQCGVVKDDLDNFLR